MRADPPKQEATRFPTIARPVRGCLLKPTSDLPSDADFSRRLKPRLVSVSGELRLSRHLVRALHRPRDRAPIGRFERVRKPLRRIGIRRHERLAGHNLLTSTECVDKAEGAS